MTPEEAIEIIKIAKAEVEWDYPMEYQIAFDEAIKALEAQSKIVHCKDCEHFLFQYHDAIQPWGMCHYCVPYQSKDADDFCKFGERRNA